MKVRFQADADLQRAIVAGVLRREPRVDFQTAGAARLRRVPDLGVLSLAAAQQRVLVSHDLGTMPRHFREFTARQRSPGVFLVPQQRRISDAIDCLILVWEASEPEEWENQIRLVPSLAIYLVAG